MSSPLVITPPRRPMPGRRIGPVPTGATPHPPVGCPPAATPLTPGSQLHWFAAVPCGRLDGARARLRAGDLLVKDRVILAGSGRPGSVASDEPAVRHGLRHACRDDRGLGGAAASGVRGYRPARTRLRAALRGHYRHRAAG